jgi:hypothetical protein
VGYASQLGFTQPSCEANPPYDSRALKMTARRSIVNTVRHVKPAHDGQSFAHPRREITIENDNGEINR